MIENKAGAGGTIAMAELARAPADGYTIAFASQGTLVFNQAIFAKPGYDSVKDFQPIAFIGGVSNVMIVPPTSAATKPADVIAAAKAKPGESTYSSGGAGTSHHLSGVLFGRVTDTQLVHVPYKGAPQGVLAVMSGEVTMGFFNTPTVIGQIKEGKVKALGVTSLQRSPLLPNVPTLVEQGVKDYEINTWFGFIAPAGTPPDIVARLNTELNRILSSADAKEKLGPQGFDLAPPIDAGRVRQGHRRRPREVGADREGVGRQGRLTSAAAAPARRGRRRAAPRLATGRAPRPPARAARAAASRAPAPSRCCGCGCRARTDPRRGRRARRARPRGRD